MSSNDEHGEIKVGKDKSKSGRRSKIKISIYLGIILMASFILFRVLVWACNIEVVSDEEYRANKNKYIFDSARYYRFPNADYQIRIPK